MKFDGMSGACMLVPDMLPAAPHSMAMLILFPSLAGQIDGKAIQILEVIAKYESWYSKGSQTGARLYTFSKEVDSGDLANLISMIETEKARDFGKLGPLFHS